MSDDRTVLVSCGSCGHQFGRMGADGEKEAIDTHYRTCTNHLGGEGLVKARPLVYTYPPCRCGREMRKLNGESSPWPACVGCGFDEENCRCQPE